MVTQTSILTIFCHFPQHISYCHYRERKWSLPPKKIHIWTRCSCLCWTGAQVLWPLCSFLQSIWMATATQECDPIIITKPIKLKFYCILSHEQHIIILQGTSVDKQATEAMENLLWDSRILFHVLTFLWRKKNVTYEHGVKLLQIAQGYKRKEESNLENSSKNSYEYTECNFLKLNPNEWLLFFFLSICVMFQVIPSFYEVWFSIILLHIVGTQ